MAVPVRPYIVFSHRRVPTYRVPTRPPTAQVLPRRPVLIWWPVGTITCTRRRRRGAWSRGRRTAWRECLHARVHLCRALGPQAAYRPSRRVFWSRPCRVADRGKPSTATRAISYKRCDGCWSRAQPCAHRPGRRAAACRNPKWRCERQGRAATLRTSGPPPVRARSSPTMNGQSSTDEEQAPGTSTARWARGTGHRCGNKEGANKYPRTTLTVQKRRTQRVNRPRGPRRRKDAQRLGLERDAKI